MPAVKGYHMALVAEAQGQCPTGAQVGRVWSWAQLDCFYGTQAPVT